MKKIILYAATIGMLAACHSKAEREAEIEQANQAAIDSVNAITDRERLDDSMQNETASEPVIAAPPTADEKTAPSRTNKPNKTKQPENPGTAGTPSPAPTATSTTETDNTTVKTDTPAPTTDPEAPAEEKKKKGINNTVKGAIIGAGAGAVGGAIINKKNPGKGAIIGGVVGAGAGAVTGVILDKNKKKKEAAKDSASKKTSTKEPDPTNGENPQP
jgi:hypothetical protein